MIVNLSKSQSQSVQSAPCKSQCKVVHTPFYTDKTITPSRTSFYSNKNKYFTQLEIKTNLKERFLVPNLKEAKEQEERSAQQQQNFKKAEKISIFLLNIVAKFLLMSKRMRFEIDSFTPRTQSASSARDNGRTLNITYLTCVCKASTKF